MKIKEFYLSSHDLLSDPRPRKCEVVEHISGLRANSNYLLVKVTPSITTRFQDGPVKTIDQIILAVVGDQSIEGLGIKPIMTDIVICPTYSGGLLDERKCSRIGVGMLHATYDEACKSSPVDADNRLESMIIAYARRRCDTTLLTLQRAFLAEKLCVPVSQPVKELEPGRYDVPVICLQTEDGVGAIPVFTEIEHLFKWKPQGCLYTSLSGRALINMATGMKSVGEILVNPGGTPRGRIPRTDFAQMLAMEDVT